MTNPLQSLLSSLCKWKIMSKSFSHHPIADIWSSVPPGQSALEAGIVTNEENDSSNTSNTKTRLCFRNYADKTLLLCWMDSDGTPHHFYKLRPCSNRGDMEAPITSADHLEQTYCGHAFCIYEYDDDDTEVEQDDDKKDQMPPSILLEPNTRLVGGYRPTQSGHVVTTKDNDDKSKRYPCHLVVIEPAVHDDDDDNDEETITCRPCKYLRGSRNAIASTAATKQENGHAEHPASSVYSDATPNIHISSKLVYLDPTPVDTTTSKSYRQYFLSNWPVFMTESDYNGLTQVQRQALETDLRILQDCLPQHVVRALQCNTPLYINQRFKYGPALCPQKASGMCFHPGVDWLTENGLHRQKVECVELYNLAEYMEERDGYWQPGGLLIHEFSHAYHYKMLKEGYENPIVKQCYQQAMRDKLYDAVEYHKRDGSKHEKPAKAYACTDQMEYFAELSVAFLGGKDAAVEFNKWFPFNRAQLQQHDPRAFKMLQQVWKLPDVED